MVCKMSQGLGCLRRLELPPARHAQAWSHHGSLEFTASVFTHATELIWALQNTYRPSARDFLTSEVSRSLDVQLAAYIYI